MDRGADLGGEDRRSRSGEVTLDTVIGTSVRMRVALVLGMSLCVVGCSSQPSPAPIPDPSAVLQAIPPADPAQYARIQNMKKWRNPYLIIRADGVVLFDSVDSAEIKFKPEDLLPELARLPASRWPDGRVVAAAENGVRSSQQDGVAIRRNKGVVGGILKGAQIAVKWVPSI